MTTLDLFLSRLRAGPRQRCQAMLRTLTPAELQGLETEANRDKRFTFDELNDTREMIGAEVRARVARGEVV